MKVRIPLWKTILLLIAVSLLAAGAMFGMSFNLFLKPIKDWSAGAWVIIAVWFVLTVLLFVLALTTSYYEVNKKYVVVRRGTKRIIYYYSEAKPDAAGNFWRYVDGNPTPWPPFQDNYGPLIPLIPPTDD